MKLTRKEFGKVLLKAVAMGSVVRLTALAGQPRTAQAPEMQRAPAEAVHTPVFVKYEDVKWGKILPDWGDKSPEIAILHTDPATQATQLLIRNPVAMHVPRHWHLANECHSVIRGNMTFECDGQREELGPGGFNYIPGKMIHQAWLPDNGLVFITVDSAWDLNWVDGPPTMKELGVRP